MHPTRQCCPIVHLTGFHNAKMLQTKMVCGDWIQGEYMVNTDNLCTYSKWRTGCPRFKLLQDSASTNKLFLRIVQTHKAHTNRRRRHQRQTRWTSKPNLNSCEWCTRCSLSLDLCISMSHTESLILIDLTTQSIQLLLSFASASFLSLETEAARSNTFKINMSFKFKVTLTSSKGSAALTWGASTASLELGFVPQCDWRMICTNYETLSNSNKSWTRRPTQISSFTTFIRLLYANSDCYRISVPESRIY